MRMMVLALAVLSLTAGPVRSAPNPDPSALARLKTASNDWNRFRVTTGRAQFLVNALHLEPEGVLLREPEARPAIIATADAGAGEARRIAWSEIEMIEGRRSSPLRGALVGAVVGGLLGLGAKAVFERDLHDASPVAIVAIPIGAVLVGVVGAWVGGSSAWHHLYP
jgi:hypothetical protein